ncbi:Uridine phosphorylase 1 [Fragariocoptes setiger]|uniref:Uridine phosphorylase 1 n=1 Tax=Fragariocoptes setiger TaxID=1670756 RepID=A0ABQ7S946_9ACAR|nr:Uridine phosphorylase 1 [Fragariocoptes setiger]
MPDTMADTCREQTTLHFVTPELLSCGSKLIATKDYSKGTSTPSSSSSCSTPCSSSLISSSSSSHFVYDIPIACGCSFNNTDGANAARSTISSTAMPSVSVSHRCETANECSSLNKSSSDSYQHIQSSLRLDGQATCTVVSMNTSANTSVSVSEFIDDDKAVRDISSKSECGPSNLERSFISLKSEPTIATTTMEEDQVCYHHFSLTIDKSEIKSKFNDLKFVLVAGTSSRVEACSRYFEAEQQRRRQLGSDVFHDEPQTVPYQLECLTKPGSRFDLYKFGPVLLSSHGIGSPSMSTAVHELLLMCHEAQRLKDIIIIRFGGGIGVDPGTLCVTTKAVDPLFRDYIEIPICGRLVLRRAAVDQLTASKLIVAGQQLAKLEQQQRPDKMAFVALGGLTISADDFYEEQGRTNGAICEHTLEDKYNFLITARDKGIINMEMEACYLMAMCHKLNVKNGVVCVALTNRLVTDRITVDSETIAQFERRLFQLCQLFIKNSMKS